MRSLHRIAFCLTACLFAPAAARGADWPTVRGNPARDGASDDCVEPPYSRKWSRSWPQETMTTRVEAIVAGGKVFVGTYQGRLHAVDAESGADAWTFQADGPILHSPAHDGSSVYFATASPGATVYRLEARDGAPRFVTPCGEGGFSASPLVHGSQVLIGGRDGTFYCLDAEKGDVLWRFAAGGPIRTTAAILDTRLFFAADDLHAYAIDLPSGKLAWKSKKMFGQSLRDYYPVALPFETGGLVIFRTNPMEQMGVHLSRTYQLLGKSAGIDISSWRNVEAYLKSGKTRADAAAYEREQRAVLEYLQTRPFARTFYVLDAATGQEKVRAPVLWGAGCQGVGVPPVRGADGRAIVFTRTAFGNWSLGVAPLVGLEVLDLKDPRPAEPSLGPIPFSRAEPIFHQHGNQPPWNTFWGTADESTNYSRGGRLLYLCHQGTLSALDLQTNKLVAVAGKRDSWGGEKGLAWARNEWHGPARGSAAIAGDSLYWATGSRLIAIRGKRNAPAVAANPDSRAHSQIESAPPTPFVVAAPPPAKLHAEDEFLRYVWERPRPAPPAPAAAALREKLERRVAELLDAPDLAPLFLEVGLGSHDFFFDTSAETVAALALASPHLSRALRTRVKERVRQDLEAFPPCGGEGRYKLEGGRRRELYTLTEERFFYGWEEPPDLPQAYALDLYGDRTGDWQAVEKLWPRARKAYLDFHAKGFRLDLDKGHRFQNGYAAGLIGVARLARRFGDRETSQSAANAAAAALRRLCEHWQAGASKLPKIHEIESVAEVDRFINAGDPLFFMVVPHRHKIAKFLDLTPEVGRAIRENVPEAVRLYLSYADRVMPAWHLAFEERQVHWGENYTDFPDLALSMFQSKAFLAVENGESLARFVDIPWCAGDLYYLEKLVRAIEATAKWDWKLE